MGRKKLNRFRYFVHPNMSKAEELALITEFVEALPEGSYLHSIFNGIEKYCEQQISNDWGINIIESMAFDLNRNFKLQSEVSTAKHDLATKNRILTETREELKEIKDAIYVMDKLAEQPQSF